MSEWQDISTAPMDGTVVLVWLQDELWTYDFGYWWTSENKSRAMIARYWGGRWYSPGAMGAQGYEEGGYETEPTDIDPVLWMPLPSPPHEQR